MGVLKNDVGRPSNKTIKMRRILKGLGLLVVVIGIISIYFVFDNEGKDSSIKTKKSKVLSKYEMKGNGLEEFDLTFLNLQNADKNIVYSPLSIKNTLGMLSEGANGDTKEQIDAIIGNYKTKKYVNSENMSFANAMFIKESLKDEIKEDYKTKINKKYNAELIYDSFKTPDMINNWISNKTFKLIDNIVDDASQNSFYLVNALAIDMNWKNKIQASYNDDNEYFVTYNHENYWANVPFIEEGYHSLSFNNEEVSSVELGATANRYDIVNELGKENIEKTVKLEYEKWLNNPDSDFCGNGAADEPDSDTYIKKYMKEIDSNYKRFDTSTDFSFHYDEDVKVFAKDLKEYNGITLQYVGIMPEKEKISDYVKNIKAEKINKIINSLKESKLENYEDKTITQVVGYIPIFDFEYELPLSDNLQKLGVKDVFDSKKSDLSNLTKAKGTYIETLHKSNINFSNEGIRASAVTLAGGRGDGGCGFDYSFDVPVKKIDLTFDKPYMFLIRDKESGEVWFTGIVNNPTKYTEPVYE